MLSFCVRNTITLVMLATIPTVYAQTFTDVGYAQGVDITIDGSLLGVGCSFYDFDKDGWDDLSIAQVGADPLFFKNNAGSFESIDFNIQNTGEIKQILWVDFDNDGDADLFISKSTGDSKLYLNDGALNFTDITESSGLALDGEILTYGCAWGDFDGDGWLDVYWANYDWGFDEDAITNMLFRNNGDGTFQDVSLTSGANNGSVLSFQPVWIDHDGDGDQDLHIINDRYAFENALIQNNGDGTFIDISQEAGLNLSFDAMSNSIVDFDNDHDLDIYMTNSVDGNVMMENNGVGAYFENTTELGLGVFRNCWAANWCDFDNDTWQDVYIATGYGDQDTTHNAAYENVNGTSFNLIDDLFPDDLSQGYSVVSGDFNNDGFVDMYMPAETGPYPSRLWQNLATSENNYLKISPQGVVSNRDGIGSWIRIFVDGQTLLRYTLCGEGYLCQDSQREIIGLGSNEVVDSLQITWLSGHVDTFYDVDANQTLHIIEGSSLTNSISTTESEICPGDSLLLDAGEFESYLWNNGETTQYIYGFAGIPYYVQVTHQFGLSSVSDSITLGVLEVPELTVEEDGISCYDAGDGALTIILENELEIVEYEWNNGEYVSTISPLDTGLYSCNVLAINGCSSTVNVYLDQPDELQGELVIDNNEGIDGSAEAVVIGGTTPYEYSWSDGQSSPIATNLQVGEYAVEITDAHGCELSLNFTILDVDQHWPSLLSIFPNPSAGTLNVQNPMQIALEFKLYQSSGHLVYQSANNDGAIILSLDHISKGLYLLLVSDRLGNVHSTRIMLY